MLSEGFSWGRRCQGCGGGEIVPALQPLLCCKEEREGFGGSGQGWGCRDRGGVGRAPARGDGGGGYLPDGRFLSVWDFTAWSPAGLRRTQHHPGLYYKQVNNSALAGLLQELMYPGLFANLSYKAQPRLCQAKFVLRPRCFYP